MACWECNGHSFKDIAKNFKKLNIVKNKPKFLIANTIKGKGIESIEHTVFMKKINLILGTLVHHLT